MRAVFIFWTIDIYRSPKISPFLAAEGLNAEGS